MSWIRFLPLVGLLLHPGFLRADPFPPDPVEPLRQALRVPVRDPLDPALLQFRRTYLEKHTQAIKQIDDLRRAAELHEWRDLDRDPSIADVDHAVREQLLKRLTQNVRDLLEKGTPADRLGAAIFVGQMGTIVRGSDARHQPFARTFTLELVKLLEGNDPKDAAGREAAVRALGQILPDPAIAMPALERALTKGQPDLRRAAAEGLAGLVTVINDTGAVQVSLSDGVRSIQEVVPVAGKCLGDKDTLVRRKCLEALAASARFLNWTLPDARPRSEFPPPGQPLTREEKMAIDSYTRDVKETLKTLRPLAEAMNEQVPALAPVLNDADLAVAEAAAEVVEETGLARHRWIEYAGSIPGSAPAMKPDDPFYTGLPKVAPALAQLLKHKEPRGRLAALYALESLGPESTQATPGLVKALSDANSFVRWGAVRALDTLAPHAADEAVPALSKLVDDSNDDVRQASLETLREFGPQARAAVAALAKAVGHQDATTRVLAIQALRAIGTDAAPAIPALIKALDDPAVEVGVAAAETLGQFGTAARSAVEALQKARHGAEPQVSQAANDALLRIR